MFILPRRADSWRPWILVGIVAAAVSISACERAHAAGPRHHHHHRVAHPRAYHHRARHQGFRVRVSRGGDAVSIALRYVGGGNPTGSGRAWCGDFVNMTERMAGRPGIASGLASAWRGYGHATGPVRGAIAVMRGHVARVIQRMGDKVMLISGNWSRRVKVHIAPLRAIVAFRAY